MPVVVVFSAFPSSDQAAAAARALVEERLAACVNIVPAVRSIYRWEGKLCDDAEVLAVIKTTDEGLPALVTRLRALHPYEVPEILALPTTGGHQPYLDWVASSVG